MAEPGKKSKRTVKNPETFRERAIKASEAAGQPKQAVRIKQAGDKAASPFRSTASRLGQIKVFRIIGGIIFPAYFRKSWQELRLVTWPSWAESRRLTYAVLVFAVIFGASIAGVDWVLDKIFKHILLK